MALRTYDVGSQPAIKLKKKKRQLLKLHQAQSKVCVLQVNIFTGRDSYSYKREIIKLHIQSDRVRRMTQRRKDIIFVFEIRWMLDYDTQGIF